MTSGFNSCRDAFEGGRFAQHPHLQMFGSDVGLILSIVELLIGSDLLKVIRSSPQEQFVYSGESKCTIVS
jgi:hypothetical protein